jgi:hypothetical protein
MNKIVLNVESDLSRRRRHPVLGDVWKPEDQIWQDMQAATAKRVKAHPASEEEIQEMLGMLGLTA